MRPVHIPWAAICALLFAGRPTGGPEAIAAFPSPALRGETVVLKWYFAAAKIIVSGGRFGTGTVVTGQTAITDRPLRTTRYVFDVWYAPEQAKPAEPAVKPAEPQAKPTEPAVKPAEPQAKPAEPVAKPAAPPGKPAESAPKPGEPAPNPAGPPDKTGNPLPTQPPASPSVVPPSVKQEGNPPVPSSGTATGSPAGGPPSQTPAKASPPPSQTPPSSTNTAPPPAAAAPAGSQLVHVKYSVDVQVIDPQALGLVPYQDSRGFRVHFLKGWERDNVSLPAPADNALMYFQPEEDSPERLAVAVLPVKDASCADIMRQVQADMPSRYDDFEVVSQSNLIHESVPAVMATCTGKDRDGLRLETIVMTLVKNDHAYVVSARTHAARFAARGGLLTNMVRSFRFVGSTATLPSIKPSQVPPSTGRSAERP